MNLMKISMKISTQLLQFAFFIGAMRWRQSRWVKFYEKLLYHMIKSMRDLTMVLAFFTVTASSGIQYTNSLIWSQTSLTFFTIMFQVKSIYLSFEPVDFWLSLKPIDAYHADDIHGIFDPNFNDSRVNLMTNVIGYFALTG